MLSIYKVLQPPKFGNCKVQKDSQKPIISLEDVKSIFENRTESYSKSHIEKIKAKLDNLIETTDCEVDEVFDHDYNKAPVLDCIIYYITGFVCRKMKKN